MSFPPNSELDGSCYLYFLVCSADCWKQLSKIPQGKEPFQGEEIRTNFHKGQVLLDLSWAEVDIPETSRNLSSYESLRVKAWLQESQ